MLSGKVFWCSILFQHNLANLQPLTALISTAGKPTFGGPQTTFTVKHNPIFMGSSKDLWKWPCMIYHTSPHVIPRFWGGWGGGGGGGWWLVVVGVGGWGGGGGVGIMSVNRPWAIQVFLMNIHRSWNELGGTISRVMNINEAKLILIDWVKKTHTHRIKIKRCKMVYSNVMKHNKKKKKLF